MKKNNPGYSDFFGFEFYSANIDFVSELKDMIIYRILPKFKMSKIYQSFESKKEKLIPKKKYLEVISESVIPGWNCFIVETKNISNESNWISGSINFEDLKINSIGFSYFFVGGRSDGCLEILSELECLIIKSDPMYGFYFSDECTNDPFCYPYGIYSDYGVKKDPSGLPLRYWSNGVAINPKEKRPWNFGIIRDVYETNFINSTHLNTIFNGMPFSSWINKSPRFGRLDQVASNLWKWQVDRTELAFVREKLKGSPITNLENYVNSVHAERSAYVAPAVGKK